MKPKSAAVYRRELLTVLRRIRDEGPLKRHIGIIGNVGALTDFKWTDQEYRWATYLFNEMVRIYGDPFSHANKDKWLNNPTLITILNRMISHMENQNYYLGTDL